MADFPAALIVQIFSLVVGLPKILEPWIHPQASRIRYKLKKLSQEGQHTPDLPKIKNEAKQLEDEIINWDRSAKLRRPKCEYAFRLAEKKLKQIQRIIEEIEKQPSNQDSNRDKILISLMVSCGKINEAIDIPANMNEWRGLLSEAIRPSRLHYVWFLVLPSVLFFSRSSLWQRNPSPIPPVTPNQCISINDTDSKVQLIGNITDNGLHKVLNKFLNIAENTIHTPSQYITDLNKERKKAKNDDVKRDIERYMPLLRILNNNTSKSAKPYYIAIAVPFDADNKPSLKALGILHGIDQAQRDLRNELKIKVVIVNDSLENSSDLKISSLAHAIAIKGYSGSQFIGLIGHPSFSNSNILETCYQKYRLPALSLAIRTPLPSSTMTDSDHFFQSLLPDAKKIAAQTSDLLEKDRRILVFHDNSTYSQSLGVNICQTFKDKQICHMLNISHYNYKKMKSEIDSKDKEKTANWFLAFDPEQNASASYNLIQHFLQRPQSAHLYLSNDFFLQHRINDIIERDKKRKTQAPNIYRPSIYRIGLWDWRAIGDTSPNSIHNVPDPYYGSQRNWQFMNSYNSFKYMHHSLREVVDNRPDFIGVDDLREQLITVMARPTPAERNSSRMYFGGSLKLNLDDKKLAPQGETSKICRVLLSDVREQVDCS